MAAHKARKLPRTWRQRLAMAAIMDDTLADACWYALERQQIDGRADQTTLARLASELEDGAVAIRHDCEPVRRLDTPLVERRADWLTAALIALFVVCLLGALKAL